MEHAILARGLVKRYGELEAVKGIDFEVPVGSVFGFLGPNGAGKSSTIRMIHGLSPRTAGRLDVLGLDIATHGREIKKRIGVVPQENNLDMDMTARENLVVFGRFFDLKGRELQERVDRMLAYVSLSEKAHERAEELSGGMKRRLHIARALLNEPELLILDEPTTGLDPQSRGLLWERIRELRKEGRTILLTTHYMDEAERLSDEVAIIDEGRIIERGAPADLVRKHVGKEALELRVAPEHDARLLSRLQGSILHGERVGEELRLFGEKGDKLFEEVHATGVATEGHVVRRATLEDVFLKLTGRQLND